MSTSSKQPGRDGEANSDEGTAQLTGWISMSKSNKERTLSDTNTGSVQELEPDADSFMRYLSSPRRLRRRESHRKTRDEMRKGFGSETVVSSPLSAEEVFVDAELLSTAQGRREWTQRQIHDRRSEYIEPVDITIFAGTWNVCAAKPTSDLTDWLFAHEPQTDVFVIALQEIQPLSGVSAVTTDPTRGKVWGQYVSEFLTSKGEFVCICERQMVGILLLVYVREELSPQVKEVCIMEAGTGFMNKGGNKGAVSMRFQIHETSFCFVACHLAAQQNNCMRRNQDYREILRKITFVNCEEGFRAHCSAISPKGILNHDLVVWLGDLNYRIDMDPVDVLEKIKDKDWSQLLSHDQLKINLSMDKDLFEGFREAAINFAPTYKTNKVEDGYAVGENGIPSRPPSYTDRVLWRINQPREQALTEDPTCFDVQCLNYRRHEVMGSDHRPVSALFRARVLKLDGDNRSRVYREVHEQLLPEIDVSPGQLWLPRQYLGSQAEATFVIKNTGKVPVKFSIMDVPSYMKVSPVQSLIVAGDEIYVHVGIRFGQEDEAAMQPDRWTTDKCETVPLEHNLRICVEDGPVVSLPVCSCYLFSIVGWPLQKLMDLNESQIPHVPARIASLTEKMVELSKSMKVGDGSIRRRRLCHVLENISNMETIAEDTDFDLLWDCLWTILSQTDKLVTEEHMQEFIAAGMAVQDGSVRKRQELEETGPIQNLPVLQRSVLCNVVQAVNRCYLERTSKNEKFESLIQACFEFSTDSSFGLTSKSQENITTLREFLRFFGSEEVTPATANMESCANPLVKLKRGENVRRLTRIFED